jgi:hypothetical protein
MSAVRRGEVPTQSLLSGYIGPCAYVDCYTTEIPGPVTHPQFIEAFYTTWLFKLERLLLGLFASRPSTDEQAKQLAHGERASFAAWRVEATAPNEILLSAGRTRSWLMVVPSAGTAATRLMFGSAVVHPAPSESGRSKLGAVFIALLPFHKVYSRALLLSAKSRLLRQAPYRARAQRSGA